MTPMPEARNEVRRFIPESGLRLFLGCLLLFLCTACAGNFQTKVSGNLEKIPPGTVVAILPVEVTGEGQEEAAKLFRQSLYACMEQSRFRVMERYLVDALLEQEGLNKPENFKKINPIRLGEMLGADAVVLPTMNRVKRTYAVIHSSIELSVSARMLDTRSGEILWMSDQTETEYEGIAKIPTGITAAAFAPVQFITNKINLHRLMQKMTDQLTSLVRAPDAAHEEQTFASPVISPAAQKEIKTVSATQAEPEPAPPVRSEPKPRALKVKSIAPHPSLPAKQRLYTVQIGAYSTRAQAEQVKARLSGKGYKTFISPSTTNGEEIFKVQVNTFKSHDEAKRYGNELWRKERIEHFVTRFQPG